MTALLEVENLVKHFVAERNVFGRAKSHVKAVDGVSFIVEAGKTLALVGESGCGKSTVSRLVLRLIEPDAGSVHFEGRDLGALDTNELRAFRRNAQIIFTTHDTNLLGTTQVEPVLRRDQVWLTEKDNEGATVLYPLTDYKPRKAENLERGYLQGRYGAIPFLGDFPVAGELSPAAKE